MTYHITRAMVEAHATRNDFWFRSLVHQLAARQRDERKKEALLAPLKKLAELPTDVARLVREVPPLNIGDLVLSERTRNALAEITSELRHRQALAERGLRARSRLLFHGPPGNGKTSCASAIAGALELRAYTLDLSSVVDSHLGETGKHIVRALGVLEAGQVLILDEVDAVGSERSGGSGGATREYNTMVSTLLTALDRPAGGVLVATTNRLDMMDPALLRRFEAQVEFPAPNEGLQRELASRLCAKLGVPPEEVRIPVECVSFDGVAKVVYQEARRRALEELEGSSGA